MVTTPVQLSTSLRSFAAEDPGDWSYLVDFARAADNAGIDKLAISDHVVFGENLEAYGDPTIGGARGGKQPTGPDGAWLDPICTIAHLSAVTSRVRFATNILVAALRRPVVLAKMAATIDVLSGGRLDIGVGVGWQREEYEAAGLSFELRGRMLNHTIEVCQTLWRNQTADYESPELAFSKIASNAETDPARGCAYMGQRDCERPRNGPSCSIWFGLGPVGERRGRRRARYRRHEDRHG